MNRGKTLNVSVRTTTRLGRPTLRLRPGKACPVAIAVIFERLYCDLRGWPLCRLSLFSVCHFKQGRCCCGRVERPCVLHDVLRILSTIKPPGRRATKRDVRSSRKDTYDSEAKLTGWASRNISHPRLASNKRTRTRGTRQQISISVPTPRAHQVNYSFRFGLRPLIR